MWPPAPTTSPRIIRDAGRPGAPRSTTVHYRGNIRPSRQSRPANVHDSRGQGPAIKVMDFGIARDTSFGDLDRSGAPASVRRAYMSPEQVLGGQARRAQRHLPLAGRDAVPDGPPARSHLSRTERRSAMHKIRLEKKHVPRARKAQPRQSLREPSKAREIDPLPREAAGRDRWRSGAAHGDGARRRFLAKHVEMNHHGRGSSCFIRAPGT